MVNDQVKTLYVKDLCNNDKYIVPIYQRNYAWGKDEIELLIQDIEEAQKKTKDKNYYIGSLVVAKRFDGYEVIDGQQRLTTLKLLLSYYNQRCNKQEHINLTFEHREVSNHSLSNLTNSSKESDNITLGYQIISNILEHKTNLAEKEHLDIKAFFEFLLNNVVILRTEVPEETDLNHYFEIMNNRGEQLEKHEVLKARLMDKLPKTDKTDAKYLFSLIWDACSDMNVYALKRFPYSNDDSKSIRTNEKFFGDFCEKIPSDFNKMLDVIRSESAKYSSSKKDILLLLNEHKINNEVNSNRDYDEIRDGKFNSIIDFPNFLMITLKVFLSEKESKKDVPLNDKFLLDAFNRYLAKERVKEFIIFLLKCRLIFDRYIIKSRDEEDSWSLNGLKKYKNGKYFYFKEVNTFGTAFESKDKEQEIVTEDINYDVTEEHRKIVQLLSMFHTAFRQKIYKDWLYDVLNYLCKENSLKEYTLEPKTYISFLEKLANRYYKDREGLAKQGGASIPHFVFNYLDYLLWKDWEKMEYSSDASEFLSKENFIFSLSRNSVEHFLPQSKKDRLLKDIPEEKRDKRLNSFGNLCLISHYQNSSLNNEIPSEKVKRYLSGSLKCISPKQALMMSKNEWDSIKIEEHEKEMMKILDLETAKFQ